MRAPRNWVVQVRRFGGPDGLEVADAPLPTAGPGEVRVRVLASGLEYTDVLIRRYLYPRTMHRRAAAARLPIACNFPSRAREENEKDINAMSDTGKPPRRGGKRLFQPDQRTKEEHQDPRVPMAVIRPFIP